MRRFSNGIVMYNPSPNATDHDVALRHPTDVAYVDPSSGATVRRIDMEGEAAARRAFEEAAAEGRRRRDRRRR
eukprot:gene32542-7027_t